ncbi:MAG: NAD(P)(+) transhydrogenase (Re/Si-specific) subunit beta, partial [Proteobacteria bacterium]|nr:NAD(P)(+) transhydrogenase (Re/Si-specific) subunit beta [Pseudomonadota bacterium]
MSGPDTLALAYLIAAVLFILGLQGLTHPKSARRGNLYAMAGMVLAIGATFADPAVQSYSFILAGIVVGGTIGTVIALRIRMTAMPQLVALLHSFVGLCAVLVAIGTYLNYDQAGTLAWIVLLELSAGTFVGAITFTGSLVAFGKLQGLVPPKPLIFTGRHVINITLVLIMLGFGADFLLNGHLDSLLVIAVVALLLGV